jgi:hypothetical protein
MSAAIHVEYRAAIPVTMRTESAMPIHDAAVNAQSFGNR